MHATVQLGDSLDDIMILEQAAIYLIQKGCEMWANELKYDWFIESMIKYELQYFLANTCLICNLKENGHQIQLRFHTSFCQNKGAIDQNNNVIENRGKKRQFEENNESSNIQFKPDSKSQMRTDLLKATVESFDF
jgi:hypothetical protein